MLASARDHLWLRGTRKMGAELVERGGVLLRDAPRYVRDASRPRIRDYIHQIFPFPLLPRQMLVSTVRGITISCESVCKDEEDD